jgi:membrane associated rhomboid family serine protease
LIARKHLRSSREVDPLLVFYLLTGAIAALAHTASEPFTRMPLVGASGAISGVLGAYLVKHPGASIRTLIPIGIFSTVSEVPAFVLLLLWVGIQFLSAPATRGHHGGGVAYLAHIGSFVAGAVLIVFFQSKERKMRASAGLRRRGISTSDARGRD